MRYALPAPDKMAGKSTKTPLERFESKLIPVTESGCWVWIGAADRYGSFFLPEHPYAQAKGMVLSHRAALYLYAGVVVSHDDHVLHKCDNTFCCNPDHLRVGTHTDNMRDMVNKKRHKIWSTKLSEPDIQYARELRKQGLTVRDIAKIVDISESQCSRLVSGVLPPYQRM